MTDTVKLIIEIPKERELIDKAIWYDVSDFDTEDLAIILTALKNGVPLDDVKALEQEPCDCISRAEAIKALEYDLSLEADGGFDKYRTVIKDLLNAIYNTQKAQIEALPPVTPKPKTDVLDKIRAEIEEQVLESLSDGGDDWFVSEKVNECLEIIDKYKAESEDKE